MPAKIKNKSSKQTDCRDKLNAIALEAHKLLGNAEDSFDSDLSLIEKLELIKKADAKADARDATRQNLEKHTPAVTKLQQQWDQSIAAYAEDQPQEQTAEEPKNIYLSLSILIIQIAIMAAALLLLGLFLTNPIMALAIVKIVTVFSVHIWSTFVLPFLIQNAVNLSIMLPVAALIVTAIKIIDYNNTQQAIAEEQQQKINQAKTYIKKMTEDKPQEEANKEKVEQRKAEKSAKIEKIREQIASLEQQLSELKKIVEPNKGQEDQKIELEKQRARLIENPLVVIASMQMIEKELFDLNKQSSLTPEQKAQKIKLEKQLETVQAKYEKNASIRASEVLTTIKPTSEAHKKFLASFSTLGSAKKTLEIAKSEQAKKPAPAAPRARSWAQKLFPSIFSTKMNQKLSLSNLATACRVLDSTTEMQSSALTKSMQTVYALLQSVHSAHELYQAGFSLRDINAAISHVPESPENKKFLAIQKKMPLPAPRSTEKYDYSREIAAFESQLKALTTQLRQLNATEKDDAEVLKLDIAEKALLTKSKKTFREETKGQADTRTNNDLAAYMVAAKKAKLLQFKAQKASTSQLEQRRQATTQITALQSKLRATIDELLPQAEVQLESTQCYQIFDQKAYKQDNPKDQAIDLSQTSGIESLQKYFISIPIINAANMTTFLFKVSTLDKQKTDYLIEQLHKAYHNKLDRITTGKENLPTQEEFNAAARALILQNKYCDRDLAELRLAFEDIDLMSLIRTNLANEGKTFTQLIIIDQDPVLQDPKTGRKIPLFSNIDPLYFERCEREDLTNFTTFLGRQFVEHLAHAMLKDIPTMLINQEAFNQQRPVGFIDMFAPDSASKFDIEQGAGPEYRTINPQKDATTVAVILAIPNHYFPIIFNKNGDSWTAYVVDSYGDLYKKHRPIQVNPIISKFKKEMSLVAINVVYSTDNHQGGSSECGIHSIENIRAVADLIKSKAKKSRNELDEYIEKPKKTEYLAYLDLAIKQPLQKPLAQKTLDTTLKKNAKAKKDEAQASNTTRREMMFVVACDIDHALRDRFNVVPGPLVLAMDKKVVPALIPEAKEEEAAVKIQALARKIQAKALSSAKSEAKAEAEAEAEAEQNYITELEAKLTAKNAQIEAENETEKSTAKGKAAELMRTAFFIAIRVVGKGTTSQESLATKTLDIGEDTTSKELLAVMADAKGKLQEQRCPDTYKFTEYSSFAKEQKLALEKKLAGLKKLESAVTHYSKASNKSEILASIKSDKDNTAQYIQDLTDHIDIIDNVLLNSSKVIGTNSAAGIQAMYKTLTQYQEEASALLPVKPTVELSSYQSMEVLLPTTTTAQPKVEEKEAETDAGIKEEEEQAATKPEEKTTPVKTEEPVKVLLSVTERYFLTKLFYGLAAEERDLLVKEELKQTTGTATKASEFNLKASDAYAAYNRSSDPLNFSSSSTKDILTYCAKHITADSRVGLFTTGKDTRFTTGMDAKAKKDVKEQIDSFNTTPPQRFR